MKRALIFFLVAAILVSVPGCVAKTRYDQALEEKTELDKVCQELTAKVAGLRSEISAQQVEIENLRGQLMEAQATIEDLQKKTAESEKE